MHKSPKQEVVKEAPEGFVWLVDEVAGKHIVGDEVDPTRFRSIRLSDEDGVIYNGHIWVRIKMYEVTKAPERVESRKADIRARLGDGDLKISLAEEAKGSEETPHAEDARTLFVDYDDQNERYKDWRKVVNEMTEYNFRDWPLDGPLSTLHLSKHMLRNGGDPRLWLQVWARHKGIAETDRVMFELRTLIEILHLGGVYDQLNMASLSSFESAARRIQSIVDAYASGSSGAPDWGAARIISGYKGPDDAVSPTLRSWAAKKGKEEPKSARLRRVSWALRKPQPQRLQMGFCLRGLVQSRKPRRAEARGLSPGRIMNDEERWRSTSGSPPWSDGRGRGVPLPSRGGRDLFPLPLPAEVSPSYSDQRGISQRRDKRRKLVQTVRDAMQSLNWMNGTPSNECFSPDPLQQDVWDRAFQLATLAGERPDSGPLQAPEATLKASLQGRGDYMSSSPASLAPFELERVSVPETLHGSPYAMDLLDADSRRHFEGEEHMLREDLVGEDDFKPYWDPRLVNSKRHYKSLIRMLHDLGYLRYTLKPKAHTGCFFVWKSDKKKIRLILDARSANRKFRDPPGASGDASSSSLVPPGRVTRRGTRSRPRNAVALTTVLSFLCMPLGLQASDSKTLGPRSARAVPKWVLSSSSSNGALNR